MASTCMLPSCARRSEMVSSKPQGKDGDVNGNIADLERRRRKDRVFKPKGVIHSRNAAVLTGNYWLPCSTCALHVNAECFQKIRRLNFKKGYKHRILMDHHPANNRDMRRGGGEIAYGTLLVDSKMLRCESLNSYL